MSISAITMPDWSKANLPGISSPATSEKMKELRTIDKWVDEQTNLLCVKMEMGGDMDTLAKMLEELKASLG